MLDLTKPIMLDGVLLTVIDPDAHFLPDRQTFCATLAVFDKTRKTPDFWKWQTSTERNEHRYFFTDTGEHVYGRGGLRVMNVPDPDAPAVGDRVRYNKRHPSNGDPSINGRTGTVVGGPVSEGHVNVEWDKKTPFAPSKPFIENLEKITVTKPLDTAKPLLVGVGQNGQKYDVPFITTTSEGHILVGKFPDARADWFIFTADGQFVRSSNNSGTGLTLRNKSVETVHYQRTTSANRSGGQSIIDSAYDTLEQVRSIVGSLPMQIVKITKTDGVITAIELVK